MLIACTGRPAAWAELLARQWPIDAALAENGALGFRVQRDASGTRQVALDDPQRPEERQACREALRRLAHQLLEAETDLGLADDNAGRVSDCTLDIGEYRQVTPETVLRLRRRAAAAGARTFVSNIHLHLTFETRDKASGAIALLREAFDEDATGARLRWAYVGDSANDAPAFAAFRTTVGVANVRSALGALSVPPRFVTSAPGGLGFAELARQLVTLREPSGSTSDARGTKRLAQATP